MNDIPSLEEPCDFCRSLGWLTEVDSDSGKVSCFKCEGTGFIPTTTGLRILALVQHNSRLSVAATVRYLGAADSAEASQ